MYRVCGVECGEEVDRGERRVKGGEMADVERKQDQELKTRRERAAGSGQIEAL
jgi:hypothetical protein